MKNLISAIGCAGLALAVVPTGGRADEGMWLLNKPPARILKERYGFEATPAWLEHLQRSCVRLDGASASFVSADGLVMTNHHVGHDAIEKLSTAERNLLKLGFVARTRDEELRCPDMEALVLRSIEDVTDRVNSGVRAEMTAAEAGVERRRMMSRIQDEAEKAGGLRCEVVTLFLGARYHLYQYRRYTDVRLVMAPEEQIAFFGGDNDNFEYPRFNLDVCFFRVYEKDRPLRPEHHLRWSRAGASDGELTFVVGHPARTQRSYTLAHLEFLRDVEVPSILRKLWRREVQLQSFSARSDEFARIAHGDRRGVENSRKAFTGIMAGLHDPDIVDQKRRLESELRDYVRADEERNRKWGDAWADVERARRVHRAFHERYAALEGRRSVLRSDLFRLARHLVRMAAEKTRPNAERLQEYTDAELKALELELFSPAPIYPDLEIDRLASGLAFMIETFGGADPLVGLMLAGRSPRQRAAELVRGTDLQNVAARRRLAEGGLPAIEKSNDAMIRFALAIDQETRRLRTQYEDEVESIERDAYARIAAARFDRDGEDTYPDATGTLRLSFGPVRGYEEEGRRVPPFTDFAGLYERMKSRGGEPPFDLPTRWIERRDRIDLKTPFNFVCTADIIGGNSGSPVVNRAGEVVGLVFDGNIQGLVWDLVYTEQQARAVAVDSRAIVEALRRVYDAGALADELLRPAAADAR